MLEGPKTPYISLHTAGLQVKAEEDKSRGRMAYEGLDGIELVRGATALRLQCRREGLDVGGWVCKMGTRQAGEPMWGWKLKAIDVGPGEQGEGEDGPSAERSMETRRGVGKCNAEWTRSAEGMFVSL